MTALITSLLVVILLTGSIVLGWRLLARRHILPCPSALIWLLENRIMENVAGSAAVIQHAHIEVGMRVLDAGCGPGRITVPLAQRVGPEGEVVALDIQESMLAYLVDRVNAAGLSNVRPKLAALGEGLLGNQQFDRAIMVTVLGEIPNREAALGEIYKALKPGGILSITEVLPDPHYQSRRTVRNLAEKVGFQVDEVYSGLRSFTMNLVHSDSA
jgi:ubiquinone/menaquinone biosynthesis C-methylase UbiE